VWSSAGSERLELDRVGPDGGQPVVRELVDVAGGHRAGGAVGAGVAGDGVDGDAVAVGDDDEAQELRRAAPQLGEGRLAGVDDGLPADQGLLADQQKDPLPPTARTLASGPCRGPTVRRGMSLMGAAA
jgi:hypothetical protein